MTKLVNLLQKAHAGEIAAYYAYEGHWKSVKDISERTKIQIIQLDELKHQLTVLCFLAQLGAHPSRIRDFVFTTIGKTLSVLCHYTGWFLPMWGALMIEQIGVVNYEELAKEAEKEGLIPMAKTLREMGAKEKEHEDYFLSKLKNDRGPSEGSDQQNQS